MIVLMHLKLTALQMSESAKFADELAPLIQRHVSSIAAELRSEAARASFDTDNKMEMQLNLLRSEISDLRAAFQGAAGSGGVVHVHQTEPAAVVSAVCSFPRSCSSPLMIFECPT